jgi:hypothetical protein
MKTRKFATILTALAVLMSLAAPAVASHATLDVEITSPGNGDVLPAGTGTTKIEGTVVRQADITVTVRDGLDNVVHHQEWHVGGSTGVTETWETDSFNVQNGESYSVVAHVKHGNQERTDSISFSVDTVVTASTDPETKEDCNNGGWMDFAFKNHGQCVRFVANGKDSR